MKPFKKACFLIVLFTFTITTGTNAQFEIYNWQGADLVKLGIGRMVTRKITLANNSKETERISITETFFDTLGRAFKSQNDACANCGTIQEFDSIAGLVSYVRVISQNLMRETYVEYDDKKRRISSETCTNGEEDCNRYVFEYDDENTERMYKLVNRRRIKHDTTDHSRHFRRLQFAKEEEKQLIHEVFYSPEGLMEETRRYNDGKFLNAALYDYDTEGRMVRTWLFDGKVKQLSTEIERNETGQLITWKLFILSPVDPLYNMSEPSIQTYEYDVDGLLVKTISKRVITEYTYFTE